LDEPTNHLDTDTVRALCEALETYEGAIIAVSHDEAFVNRVIATSLTGDKKAVAAGSALQGELWVMSKKKVCYIYVYIYEYMYIYMYINK
jgi:ATPase subunit of ABC transporter with duplicated ATPase domains